MSSPVKQEVESIFRITFLVLILVILFYASNVLLARAMPEFPPPTLKPGGMIRFDTARIQSPTLLALSVSPKGNVGILDSKSGIVQVFSPEGKFLFQTPNDLPENGKLKRPLGLAFGEKEEIYLADTGNQRVVQFSANGEIKILGKPGVFNGQFVLPTSLLAVEDNLFVLDTALCRIQQFTQDGYFMGKVGRKGDVPGAFRMPIAMAKDPRANLLVLDSKNSTLSQFDFLLNFTQQRKVLTPSANFTLSKAAFSGEELSFFLSKSTQEIIVFFQNTAIEILTPEKLNLGAVVWTDLAGHGNRLHILDGKNRKVDVFELM